MNRRNFIFKALATVAAAPITLLAKSWLKPGKVLTVDQAREREGMDYFVNHDLTVGHDWTKPEPVLGYDPADYEKPYRRVLVMTAWWIEDGYSTIRSDVATSEMRETDPFKPRQAYSWKDIRFEDLKKGDHFRLIDVPQESGKGNEDGRTVAIALDDPRQVRDGNWAVTIDPKHCYPGKGAGFDWLELKWGDEYRSPELKAWQERHDSAAAETLYSAGYRI